MSEEVMMPYCRKCNLVVPNLKEHLGEHSSDEIDEILMGRSMVRLDRRALGKALQAFRRRTE